MKPKKDQLDVENAYANDQVPEWWDREPTHEELIAEEMNSQRQQEHDSDSEWIQAAMKKGPKPF